MKVAVITDTHFGARSNNKLILEHQLKFLENVFFPEIRKRGIEYVFHLGDLVESKTKIDIAIHNAMHTHFLEVLNDDFITYMIPGNHDLYFKDSLRINAMTEFAEKYENIWVFKEPTEILDILMVPWICEENYNKCINSINTTKSQVCFGHFEITGAKMNEGRVCEHGLNKSIFQKFDVVASGHFHSRSKLGNIEYIGNPHQTTWSDWDEERGFSIFDTDSRTFEFIKNPENIFEKIIYNDSENINMEPNVHKKYVKLIVKTKNDPYKFEQYVNLIENAGPIELKIIEDVLDLGVENADELINSADSVNDLLDSYVDQLKLDVKNEKVKKFLQELYNEAQLMEA